MRVKKAKAFLGNEGSAGLWLQASRWQVAWIAMALQLSGHQDFAKDVGRALLGRRTAKASGPVGQCAPAHSVHLLERPEEVWAAWRALFLPYQEGAGGFERGVVKSLCLCGNAQCVRANWSPPFGSRGRRGSRAVL